MTKQDDLAVAAHIRDRLIKQLSVANEQLEQFAHVAAHDLREPLRLIVSFTDLLAKEYGNALDDTAQKYMTITRQAAHKMEAMVADMLEYSRLGANAERFTEVNTNSVWQEAIETMHESIQSTRATLSCDPLPVIVANPLRLSRLFQNLLGNALKYQTDTQCPVIHLTVQDGPDYWLFSLADNGIGIEEEYLEIIFSPFKRLHSDHEYMGTGIGLSICKRIVESFGGTIWVESQPGQGSVFYFTIPKRTPN